MKEEVTMKSTTVYLHTVIMKEEVTMKSTTVYLHTVISRLSL